MERYEKKKYLRSYQSTLEYIQKLKEQYEEIYTEATKIVPTLSDMPSSNVHDDKVILYVAKMAEIQKKIDRAKKKIARIDRELAKLKPFHYRLIRDLDIRGFSVTSVARKTKNTEAAIRQMRNRIIDRMFESG